MEWMELVILNLKFLLLVTCHQSLITPHEGAALFFLHCTATSGSADDRTARKLFSQPHFDVTRLDTWNNSRLPGRERLP
jgi:hypothetical protein